MHTRRSAIKLSAVLCWVAALSTVIWDIPGDKSENLIFAIAITVTLVWRLETRPSMRDHMRDNFRHIGQILYWRGVHDGMRGKGGQGAGHKAPASDGPPSGRALRTRRWQWVVRLAVPAVIAVALAVAITASPASPFVTPMPGVYVVQPEAASEPMRARPGRVATAPSTPAKTRKRVASSGPEVTDSPRSEAPAPVSLETPAPIPVVQKPVKTVRSKAPKVPRPRVVLSSLLDR